MVYFDLDHEYDAKMTDRLLACDAIHLSGGNTYRFLHSVRKRRFGPVLREYAMQGGALIGVSAGSILMTPSIRTAGLYPDDNSDGLTNLSSLDLVGFEFFPHLDRERWTKALLDYSAHNDGRLVYACRDGDGIIVSGDEMQLFGNILTVRDGYLV